MALQVIIIGDDRTGAEMLQQRLIDSAMDDGIIIVGDSAPISFAEQMEKQIEISIEHLKMIEIDYADLEERKQYHPLNRCVGKPIKTKCRINHHRIRHATHAQCKYAWRAKKTKKYRG